MTKRLISFFLFIFLLTWVTLVYAVDINLINVDMSPDDNSRLANAYGQAYGYPPQQVTPLLSGPPQEVPAILQIAQAASQVPTTVWMMRRMGMSYSSILSTFALAPSVLSGGPVSPYGYPPAYSPPPPYWARWTDPFYVQTARVYFLKNILGVPPQVLPLLPVRGIPFAQSILYPYHPAYGYWMPPGIAKKYGLWIPPGQAKKMGWGPWGWGHGDYWKDHKHGWKDHDWHDHDWDEHSWEKGKNHWEAGDDHHGHGNKFQGDEGGHGKGHHGPGGPNLAQGNEHSKGNGNSHGGSSSQGNGGSHGKGKK
jgi:hypothetical protein